MRRHSATTPGRTATGRLRRILTITCGRTGNWRVGWAKLRLTRVGSFLMEKSLQDCETIPQIKDRRSEASGAALHPKPAHPASFGRVCAPNWAAESGT